MRRATLALAALALAACVDAHDVPQAGALEAASDVQQFRWAVHLYAGADVECPSRDRRCFARAVIRVFLDDGRIAFLEFHERQDFPLDDGDWTIDHQGAITVALPFTSFESWRRALERGATLRVVGSRLQLDEVIP